MARRGKKQKKEPEPTRHYDCKRYDECLEDAARRNASNIRCVSCGEYERGGRLWELTA